ncbi:MAG TPA: YihY/virulence factor BrkB family protein [Dehalococcoidia bacterium]|nr:YihY/virulence factor BrkB family protein [Dehalococcoidia bacterium]
MAVGAQVEQAAVDAGNRVPAPLSGPRRVGLGRLVREALRRGQQNCLAVRAGNLAFRAVFALFPAAVSALWLLTALHQSRFVGAMVDVAGSALPKAAGQALKQQVAGASGTQAHGDLTFGAVIACAGAIWAAAGAVMAAMEALNAIYGVKERRPLWKRWGIAVLLSLGVALLLIAVIVLVVFGTQLANRLSHAIGAAPSFGWLWAIVSWPLLVGCVLTAFALVYYAAPDADLEYRWIRTGSLLAAVLWLLFTAGFSLYINNFAAPTEAYGALAGVAVLMIFGYATAYIFLLGAQMNQVIESDGPAGQDRDERRTRSEAGR